MTREELSRYRDEAKELKGIRNRIAQLENQLYDLHSPAMTGMPTAHSTEGGSSQERAADRASEELDKLRVKYKRLETDLAVRCSAVEDAIISLPGRCRTVFRAYYLDGLTWEAIAWEYHWSFSTIARIKRRGYALLCKSDIEWQSNP